MEDDTNSDSTGMEALTEPIAFEGTERWTAVGMESRVARVHS